jgi:predicted dehydrogenase
MVGGGRKAFIGAVQLMAMRLDDQAQLVAGTPSSNPENARLSGANLGLDPDRAYYDFIEMVAQEAPRPAGVEAVVIVTPNHMCGPVARAYLEAGIDVISNKPLTAYMDEAGALAALKERSGLVFAVTLNNTSFVMVQHAPQLAVSDALVELLTVRADYSQD